MSLFAPSTIRCIAGGGTFSPSLKAAKFTVIIHSKHLPTSGTSDQLSASLRFMNFKKKKNHPMSKRVIIRNLIFEAMYTLYNVN
jgi:hypothetical protein